MYDVIREISSLLEDGPQVGKETLHFQTFELILSLTDKVELREHFSEEFLGIIMKYLRHKSPFNSAVYKIFINLSSDVDFSLKLCQITSVMSDIIRVSLSDIYDNSKDADYCCMLLSNVTRSEVNCLQILNYLNPFADSLHKMVSVFSTVNNNSTCSLDQLSMVLCNLSQLAEVRTVLIKAENALLQKLIPFMTHENAVRREGIIGLVHNCSFDSSVHDWMLNEGDILPRLLLPLAGAEQFDDEDNDKLPIDLQYLPDTKCREKNPEIRKQLLETLNQLCVTKSGRQILRDHNTYIILRELHKCEENPSVLLACENVVDILIRMEDEIGFDNLNKIEIPPDLGEQFNKDLTL